MSWTRRNGAETQWASSARRYSTSFWQTGGWNRLGKNKIIRKAEVFLEDPIGLPGDVLSLDEDENVERKKRQPKMSRRRSRRKVEKETKAFVILTFFLPFTVLALLELLHSVFCRFPALIIFASGSMMVTTVC